MVTAALIAAASWPGVTVGDVLYVDGSASGTNDGSSWDDAFVELQSALAEAGAGDEVWVAEGRYLPDYDVTLGVHTGNRLLSFVIPDGVKVYGGFAGTETLRSERNPGAKLTILDGYLDHCDLGGVSVEMLSPPTGTTLDCSFATMTFSEGLCVDELRLTIGSAPSGSDLVDADITGQTSHAAYGMPTDGRTLYVTLWTTINSDTFAETYQFTAAADPTVESATMTDPVPDSALTSNTQTFMWSAGTCVEQYGLRVGTSVGAGDVYDMDLGTATSAVVENLPADGSTVHVALRSRLEGAWQETPYTYTAATLGTPATMISPPAGSKLDDTSVQFTWDPGTNVEEIELLVGTSEGAGDLYQQNVGQATSKTVNNLLDDGSIIHVTLRSFFLGRWYEWASTYEATGMFIEDRPAEMLDPADGVTLSSANQTFTWDAGVGVSSISLWIGSSPEAYDLLAEAKGQELSHTVTDLPVDGRTLYVTLWSLMNEEWVSNTYTYTAYTSTGLPVPAEMQTPANGSTFDDTSVDFIWTGGEQVTSISLWVGSSYQAFDIYAESMGLDTSVTVNGLPDDGRSLYVTLWSLIAGEWQSRDYEFTASCGGCSGALPGEPLSPAKRTSSQSGPQASSPPVYANAHHVVKLLQAGSGTVLDGFIIRRGISNGLGDDIHGAGVFIEGGAPIVSGCRIEDNFAASRGGAIYARNSSAVLMNLALIANHGDLGGGVFLTGGEVTLANILFNQNEAGTSGGGIHAVNSLSRVVHATIVNNTAGTGGGVFASEQMLQVHNSILRGNTPESVVGMVDATYSCLDTVMAGTGNLIGDPVFADPDGADDVPGNEDDDFSLMSSSPCIDAGDNVQVPEDLADLDGDLVIAEPLAFDLAWWPRAIDAPDVSDTGFGTVPLVDMGAYEYGPDCDANDIPDVCDAACGESGGPCDVSGCGTGSDCDANARLDACEIADNPQLDLDENGVLDACESVIHVDIDAAEGGDGASWATAYRDLQDAIDIARPLDEIWVAEGMYLPTFVTQESDVRTAAFVMADGVRVFGGFAGTETTRDERDPVAHPAVLSGDIGIPDDIGDNSYHVVIVTTVDDVLLDGLVIEKGNANGVNQDVNGGGAICTQSTVTFRDCVFRGNRANVFGGAIYNSGSSPMIAGCTFVDNTVTGWGGAISNRDASRPTVINSRFLGNRAEGAFHDGGAIDNFGASGVTAINSIFSANTAGDIGGAINLFSNSSATIQQCTFHANEAVTGGTVSVNATSTLAMSNSIIWGAVGGALHGSGTKTITYSLVEGGAAGLGNLDADPKFVDADGADDVSGTEDDDLTLQPNSPALDAGDDDLDVLDPADLDDDADVEELLPVDLNGRPRRTDQPYLSAHGPARISVVDMGAYELEFAFGVDRDGDGDVDSDDHDEFAACATAPAVLNENPNCDWADFDGDGDIDQRDFMLVQRCLSGEGQPAAAMCLKSP